MTNPNSEASPVPAPPCPITPAPNHYVWSRTKPLYRVFDARRRITDFNPGVGDQTRFAPIVRSEGTPIPTLYAGESVECAFFERIFRNVPLPAEGLRTVHVNQFDHLACGAVLPTRDLTLAALFRPDLERWNLRRGELVHSGADHYAQTAAWAAALHRDFPPLDGLVWTSNQSDPALAVLLFGDRCAEALTAQDPGSLIVRTPSWMNRLNDCAERAGIRITRS